MLASTQLVAMEMAEEDELREMQLWEFITGGGGVLISTDCLCL